MRFFIVFVSIYILIYLIASLPVMLGWGVVIDFTEQATTGQKVTSYIVEGLQASWGWKMVFAWLASLGLMLWRRTRS
ncbi:hypothetical protein NDK47_03840 [Brevibacillus ruminantium]|uniref:Uncharacterized protein n=1 Tax=Brevibacillus ruminantium TaxID=2950604 RepID=A0ABY4WKQ7_9BACL|nr:hypothetical protein [Brevibacillus ruminantium]USG66445.1 hypothetical protein NDK47_03840 [Brevibacillus ruminantium]